MIKLQVQITPDIARVAAALKELDAGGETKLKAAFQKELRNNIGKRVVQMEKSSIMATKVKGVKASGSLRHKRGGGGGGQGLRSQIANSVKTRNRLTNSRKTSAGIEVYTSATAVGGYGRIPKQADRGTLRHPLFGDREHWYKQQFLPRGWWSRTVRDATPYVNAQLRQVVSRFEQVVNRAASGG